MNDMTTPAVLLPCPFCGEVPTIDSIRADDSQGGKWGSVNCCITGPEVRTGYKLVEHWRDAAISAWNRRTEGK